MAAVTQHRPHGAIAGRLYGTLDGKTAAPASTPQATQHRPHGAFAGLPYGTLAGKTAASGAALISAAYGTPLSGTTATVGCTTDTASGTLYIVVTTSITAPSIAQIKAGQDHTGAAAPWGSGAGIAVSSTSPSTTATGLTAATDYYTHCVQTVSAVDSNVATSALWATDNTGSGGGTTPAYAELTSAAGTGSAGMVSATGGASVTLPSAAGAGSAGAITATGGASATLPSAAGVGAAGEVSATASAGGGTGATAAQIWGYVMSNGQTAEANVLTIFEYLSDLHLIHGLRTGSPLTVSSTQRSAGAVVQALSEAVGTVTVTRQP